MSVLRLSKYLTSVLSSASSTGAASFAHCSIASARAGIGIANQSWSCQVRIMVRGSLAQVGDQDHASSRDGLL
jgi:hypothetical protein